MEKVSSTQSQSLPIWERQKNRLGHRSAVQGALQAHRERVSERETRTQDRMSMVQSTQNPFFTEPQAYENSGALENQALLSAEIINAEVVETPLFNPRQIDAIYDEAQVGSSTDKAILIVNKEVANPEEGPVEDVPKGSYVDYTV